MVNSAESKQVTVNYGGTNRNIFAEAIDSSQLTIVSDGAVDLNNTKFLEVEMHKKKPVQIKERQ